MKVAVKREYFGCFIALLVVLSGCFRVSGGGEYKGPPIRPQALTNYYASSGSYGNYSANLVEQKKRFNRYHIVVSTPAGPVSIEYFKNHQESDNLVFVFPVLGGKNIIENHLASYFADRGIDSAVVLRNNEFKDPSRFDSLEQIFRKNVLSDRFAIDFFEQEFHKKHFGSFGISRGAINVAMTAGIDPRLKYNIMALGGTDIPDLFRDSNQKRIKKYVASVMTEKKISEDKFYKVLRAEIKTAPENTAQYIDARNALLILAVFDKTVPFEYGLRLRKQMGYPDTIFLVADHYTGLLYTQTASIIPPRLGPGYFPFPYIEQEAMSFYRRKFKLGSNWRLLPYKIIQTPVNLAAEAFFSVGDGLLRMVGEGSYQRKVRAPGFWEKAPLYEQ